MSIYFFLLQVYALENLTNVVLTAPVSKLPTLVVTLAPATHLQHLPCSVQLALSVVLILCVRAHLVRCADLMLNQLVQYL